MPFLGVVPMMMTGHTEPRQEVQWRVHAWFNCGGDLGCDAGALKMTVRAANANPASKRSKSNELNPQTPPPPANAGALGV